VSRREFLEKYAPQARSVSSATQVRASVILAMWGHESAFGSSAIFRENNNIAGIKYVGQSLATGENRNHAVFPSVSASIQDYQRILGLPYMREVRAATSPEREVRLICDSPYATDELYGDKVLGLWRKYNMSQYDDGATEPRVTPLPGGEYFSQEEGQVTVRAEKTEWLPWVMLLGVFALLGVLSE